MIGNLALTVLFVVVVIAVAFVAFHGGRDAAERETDRVLASYRLQVRTLTKAVEDAREETARMRRIALRATRDKG